MNVIISVVVPFLNEAENLTELYNRLCTVFECREEKSEFLFVDDGSSDNSVPLLMHLQKEDPRIRILKLSRNFGHQSAVSAGLMYAKGKAVCVLDADLQDPPEVLVEMFSKWKEGNDVVYGVRRNRKEGLLLRTAYYLFYRILKRMVPFDVPVDAGDFALLDRRVVDAINGLPEKKRFVRGLRGWVGYRQVGLPYDRDARSAGYSKYSWAKLVTLALDGIVAYSTIPLRIAIWIGSFSALVGLVYLFFVLFTKLTRDVNPSGWASLACIVLVFGGVQLLVLGIIGEYIGRIYEEVKARPTYIVDEIIET